jgi:hypothetical protein
VVAGQEFRDKVKSSSARLMHKKAAADASIHACTILEDAAAAAFE